MVNTKEYTNDSKNYLDVDTVKNSPTKVATIMPGAYWKEYNNTDPDTGEQKVIEKPVLNIELDEKMYEWPLNKTTNEQLIEDFGTAETDDWAGKQVKLMTSKIGNIPYITATGLPDNE